jgi:hypothetical protein
LNWVTPVSSLAASPHLNPPCSPCQGFFSAPFRGNRENALHTSYHTQPNHLLRAVKGFRPLLPPGALAASL